MTTNPYAAPDARDSGERRRDRYGAEIREDGDEATSVSEDILASMRLTRPWVRFLTIVGYVFSILVIVGGMFVGASQKTGAGVGLGYAIGGALYLFPTLHLGRYAKAIQGLLQQPDQHRLAEALRHQKSFWRTVGMMTAGLLVLYAVGIVVFAFYMTHK
jgi:hypothetical protein